jgi:hypothetical protein
MHRWIIENDYGPSLTDDLTIRDTTIAKYWPGLYFNVHTWRGGCKNIAARLSWALENKVQDFKDAERLMPDRFVTLVCRCDKYGISRGFLRSPTKPLFERVYATLEEAEAGHKEAVARFS